MKLSEKIYKAAAEEHVWVARELYNGRRFVLGAYIAGLAVECLLRAYRYRRDPEFNARHDLFVLYKASGILGYVLAADIYSLNAALFEVHVRGLMPIDIGHQHRSNDT